MRIIRTIIFCTCVVVSLSGTAFSAYRNQKNNVFSEPLSAPLIEICQNLFDIRPQSFALELPKQETASLKQLPKLAAVHFLTNEGGLKFDANPTFPEPGVEDCKSLGYTLTSCDSGSPANVCPYNSSYFKSCCSSEYKYTSCAYPLTKSSDSCGGKYKCVCDTALYPVTTASCTSPMVPASGEGTSCTANGETRYSECVCPSSYTEVCDGQNMQGSGTGCTKNGNTLYKGCECQTGYNLTCSGEGNSPVKPTDYCLKDGIKYYNNCNTCPFRCTIAEADKQAGIVYEYEECSKKYCDIGCATGYVDWCVKPETDCAKLGYTKSASQCANGYLKCPYNSAAVFCEDEEAEADTSNKDLVEPSSPACLVANCTKCVTGSSSECSKCAENYTLTATKLCLYSGPALADPGTGGCISTHTPQVCEGKTYCCPDKTLTDCSKIKTMCVTSVDEQESLK